ncbi:MAG: VWA domain-containing protein [Gammaproteobacteria bacterium]|nr:VWA domain-containing protein [Gammaproteobacteria bacterium]
MFAEFHFIRPYWLLALVPLIIFLVWFARRRFALRRWRDVVDPALMPHVLIGAGHGTRRRLTGALGITGVLMILALAGPAWERMPQPVFRSQDALVVALDLSRSMDATDVKPSRLARARYKISDILERRDEGQSALLVYAAETYIVSPLTDDTRTIASQLPALDTALMPSQGSRADRALVKAGELLRQAGAAGGRVLLVTDGVESERDAAAASALRESGYRVSVLGVGTREGGPIPGGGGFIKRRDGSIVLARLEDSGLREVATAGGGDYLRLTADETDVDRLSADADVRRDETEETGLEADLWREEGPWLLLPLLPLVALAFRRGVVAVWLLAAFLPLRPAEAFEWDDLWSRPDQRAARLIERDDVAGAAELFEDPEWKGAAAYRAGDYESSVKALEGLDGPDAKYNRGNALARLGRYDEAIAAYDEVLERDAGHRDARHNRDLLQEQLDQQQQQQQEQSDGESQQDGDQSQESGSDQQEAGSDGESQQDDEQSQQSNSDQGSPDQAGQQQDPDASSGDPQETPQEMPQETSQESPERQQAQEGDDGENEDVPAEPRSADEQEQAQSDETGEAAQSADALSDEEAQAMEQWLRRIPDDPAGLLRRKFYYQYQQQPRAQQEEEQW